MYDRRLKIFIMICAVPFAATIARLAQMQLVSDDKYRDMAEQVETGKKKVLKTVRGRILDRGGAVIAGNEVKFFLCIRYKLSQFADERFWQAEYIRSRLKNRTMQRVLKDLNYDSKRQSLSDVIYKCSQMYGMSAGDIQAKLAAINDAVWTQRTFAAWYRNCLGSELRRKYELGQESVNWAMAMADFEKQEPDASKRFAMIAESSDVQDAYRKFPLIELHSDQEIFSAQMEFPDSNDVEVLPIENRVYPFGSAASQTIGWVGFPQDRDLKLFAGDRRARYLDNELCGHSGIEYICEPMLRGRRGQEVYTFDRSAVVDRTETEPGQDVRLTLDIALQSQIEESLGDYVRNGPEEAPIAAVVIDVASSEILSLVSLPTFDPARIRQTYSYFAGDPNGPLVNRAINNQYPAGSVIKPVIGIAGLEEHAVRADEVISCPSKTLAPPNCMLVREKGIGHDEVWPNIMRNGLKGSCNVYFSRLAERLSSAQLQKWLLKFGYGTAVLREQCLQPSEANEPSHTRTFEQLAGIIYSGRVGEPNVLSPISDGERRFFGIGQGSMRVTPLQVANAMAALARDGIYRPPHLFKMGDSGKYDGLDLEISPQTIHVIRDGMHAVTSEQGGTAYSKFRDAGFGSEGVTLYGKTGSTEAPEHAWFAGFAQDRRGRSIAFSVLVERGKLGAENAAPLARRIIQLCIDKGYIGPGSIGGASPEKNVDANE